jgi:hypothetical protein
MAFGYLNTPIGGAVGSGNVYTACGNGALQLPEEQKAMKSGRR